MRKLFALATLITGTLYLVSCGDDDSASPAEPQVTAPSGGIINVPINTSTTISFPYTTAGGYASSVVNVVGGTAEITSEGLLGAESGTIDVNFTAGTAVGAGSVELVVTDLTGQTGTATAVINVTGSAIPAISGIPETASVSRGEDLVVNGVTLTFADGFGSFTLSVNGGNATDISATIDDTSGETGTANITYPTDNSAFGRNSLLFTLTDADGDVATFEHILTVTAPTKEIASNIATNTTFDSDTIYILASRIAVVSGVTLTIEPGTIIKGRAGTGTNATALLIANGATLNANGTAAAPIIFTSVADNIQPGEIEGTLEPDVNGLWGGLIVLGDAIISAAAIPAQIEGIPSSDTNGLYGGTNDDDNSGSITYISIRHGGANIGEGNEINGLTLGGVGSGTTINWVEIVANQDDGIEWFGGKVDVSNALTWNVGDDGLDTDQDWQGTCNGFIIVTPDGSAFELDGPEGLPARDGGVHTFTNGTVYAGNRIANLVDWDDDTNAGVNNVYFYGISADYYTEGRGVASFGGDGVGTTNAWQITLPTGGSDTRESMLGAEGAAITTEVAANANTVGPADATGYEWTFASQSGALSSIGL